MRKKCKGGACLLNPLGYEPTCWDCKQYSGKRPMPPKQMPSARPFAVTDDSPAEDAHDKRCPVCGALFWGRHNKIYCSNKCKKKAYKLRYVTRGGYRLFDERECVICHLPFRPHTDRQVTCGGECNKKYMAAKYRRGVPKNHPRVQVYARRRKMETAYNAPVEHLRETILQIRRHNPSASITPSGVDALARQIDARLPWWRSIDRTRQAALLDIAFSWGLDGLRGMGKLISAIRSGRWNKVKPALLNTRYAATFGKHAVENARQLEEAKWTVIKPYVPSDDDEDDDDDEWADDEE